MGTVARDGASVIRNQGVKLNQEIERETGKEFYPPEELLEDFPLEDGVVCGGMDIHPQKLLRNPLHVHGKKTVSKE